MTRARGRCGCRVRRSRARCGRWRRRRRPGCRWTARVASHSVQWSDGVGELPGGRVEDAEALRRRAPCSDRDQPVVERGEPPLPELPQRPAELLLARAELDRRAGRPGRRRCRFHQPLRSEAASSVPSAAHSACATDSSRAADERADLGERAVRCDLGEHQLGAVPRHPRVVPGDPDGLPPSGESFGPVTKRWSSEAVRGPRARSSAAEPSSGTAAIDPAHVGRATPR